MKRHLKSQVLEMGFIKAANKHWLGRIALCRLGHWKTWSREVTTTLPSAELFAMGSSPEAIGDYYANKPRNANTAHTRGNPTRYSLKCGPGIYQQEKGKRGQISDV
ncbi:hypothetical protein CDD81_1443 [Ophiocordyceps australis]|uniref:Uncharacterized protein n=1 Tax=Ophiocordyceps australis TaxID=1399860 RepID=A0A2C5XVW0_9HYPO|nr:hypothetical protein CDD81_1443 [Ophiocordyceps australis]